MAIAKNIERLMEKEEFINYMTERLKRYFGRGAVVENRKVIKNNGVIYEGVVITERDANMSPTIYLDELYDAYTSGCDAEEIFYQILSSYEKYRVPVRVDVSFYMKYEKVRRAISFKLVNYERNKEMLKEVPHRRYMDLAVVYMCVLRNMELGNASIIVRNEHLEMWQVNEEMLFEQAIENAPLLLKPSFRSMNEYCRKMGILQQEMKDMTWLDNGFDMFILSNECNTYGASVIMYPGLLKRIARELESDLILLPSSVHEIIVLPECMAGETELLVKMVKEVNDAVVKEEEILSYSIYIFERETGEIREYCI